MLYNCAKSCHQDIPDSFYDIQAEDIDGNIVDFKMFRDKVVYIVNVASEVSLFSFLHYVLSSCSHSLLFLLSHEVRIHCRELSSAQKARRTS